MFKPFESLELGGENIGCLSRGSRGARSPAVQHEDDIFAAKPQLQRKQHKALALGESFPLSLSLAPSLARYTKCATRARSSCSRGFLAPEKRLDRAPTTMPSNVINSRYT